MNDNQKNLLRLQESEYRFRTLFEQTPSIAVQGYDAQRRVIFWNSASERLYGYSAEEALGQYLEHLIIPEALWEQVSQRVDGWLTGGPPPPPEELYLQRKDGSLVPVFSNHVIQHNKQGQAELYCLDIDLTPLKAAQARLQLAASVFTHTQEGILIVDAQGRIVQMNEALTHITGYERAELIGKNPRILQSGEHNQAFYASMWRSIREHGYWRGEIWNRRKNGERYAVLLTINAVCDTQDQVTHYVGLSSDITVHKEYQKQLEYLAFHDALTGLSNRVALTDRLQQAMLYVQRQQQRLAVIYLDLDGFKWVNERYGITFGDQVLVVVAQRLNDQMRAGDTLARLGGDEFVGILNAIPEGYGACEALFSSLLQAAAEPILLEGQRLQISASLGVTYYPQTGEVDADQLLRQADQAMYAAKRSGKNHYRVFDAGEDRHLREHQQQLVRLRQALAENEFVLYYQPQVNLRTGDVVGAEALIRWQHPERGLLPPGAFLPMLDDSDLVIPLGEWVIQSALQQLVAWQSLGMNCPVSVNISAHHIQQANFTEQLRCLLEAYPQIPPHLLELEILETHALEDMVQVSRTIQECADFGIRFALDDFGTGYASLTYLKQLPVRLLKIDQSFVRDMLEDANDLAIVKGILGLATAFGHRVIAEGVETYPHAKQLLQLGCDMAQGYCIARPMPAQALPAWVAQWKTDPVRMQFVAGFGRP